MLPAEHWENVYKSKADAELSWFQRAPEVSVALIKGLGPGAEPGARRVIDVGGGQSALAGELLERGLAGEVTVLDISAAAVERGKARLGAPAARVRWIVGDVLEAGALGPVDVWHDRAVFHFLTRAAERRRYAALAAGAVAPGGHAIVATFAPTGPEKCSGLAVSRFDAPSLAAEFAPHFELVASRAETHTTPWGKGQGFTWVVLRRIDA